MRTDGNDSPLISSIHFKDESIISVIIEHHALSDNFSATFGDPFVMPLEVSAGDDGQLGVSGKSLYDQIAAYMEVDGTHSIDGQIFAHFRS